MTDRHLLVIDDEVEFAKHVGRTAEDLGYVVAITTQAQEFKNVYDTFDPEVIVLDMVMPEVDGIELINWLATRNCQAKLVIVTGTRRATRKWSACWARPRAFPRRKGIPPATALRAALAPPA